MRLKKNQIQEAIKMREEGKSVDQIAYRYSVHVTTMRRYLRNFEVYGESLWSTYPEERIEK